MKRSIGLLAAASISACGPGSKVELSSPEARVQIEADPFRVVVMDADRRELLSTLTDADGPYGPPAATKDAYELIPQVVPGWDGYVAHEAPWRHFGRGEITEETDTSVTVSLADGDRKVDVVVSIDGPRVGISHGGVGDADGTPDKEANKISVSFALGANEHFFGLGERYASFDHRGLSLYSWAEEAGLGLGENVPRGPTNPSPNGPSMTYFPVPFFLSSEGYAFHAATTHRTEMHLGSERPGAWRLAVNGPSAQLTIYVRKDPIEAISDFTADTGRPPIPAPWVFGPRRRVGSGSRVDGVEEWKQLRRRGVPTTGLDDAVHFLPQNSHFGREAELLAWTSTAHANGFKVMGYNNPYVSATLQAARAEYEHGRDNGFFVRDTAGKPGLSVFISGELQSVASIDFTNPGAVRWYQDLLRRTLALGYDGWMHDFGEYIERDWVFFDGRRGSEMHNLFPVLSAKAAYELLEAERPGDYLFFVRSGYTGTQGYVPAVWGGDPEATFDDVQGLPSALRGGLNLALTGVPYFGSDVSGFKCITEDPRDKEVYLRWAQLGAVSPIMHDQNACTNVLGRKQKWTLWSDEETTRLYGDMARLHTRLLPYFLVLAREAHETGTPLMRPFVLTHPREPAAWTVDHAFFLGPSLLAAPVVRRGQREKTLWLPPGRYVDLSDYAIYQGGAEVAIPAPLDKLPLLLVENRMLPLLDRSIETLAPATEPTVVTPEDVADRLDVIVFLSPMGEARMSLADGTELVVRRSGIDQGNPTGLTEVTAEALETCSSCFHERKAGALERVGVSTALTSGSNNALGDLELVVRGGPARRVRWDVLLAP